MFMWCSGVILDDDADDADDASWAWAIELAVVIQTKVDELCMV